MINKISFSIVQKYNIWLYTKSEQNKDQRWLTYKFGLAHGIWLSNAYWQYPKFICYFFVTKYLSGIIPKTKACLLCLLFILILSLVDFALLAHSTKTKLVESENFSLDVLHFDPKHRTFNFVSIVCIDLTFYRWFGSRQLSFERMEKRKV